MPKGELADFTRWTGMVKPGDGDAMYRHNGAGEMLVFTAADFDFIQSQRQVQVLQSLGCRAFEKVIQHHHQASLRRVAGVYVKATDVDIGRILNGTDLRDFTADPDPFFTGVGLLE